MPPDSAAGPEGSIIGVDVGGTFTDVLSVDGGGIPHIAKVPSERSQEAAGFLAGLESAGLPVREATAIVHGTTVGTNALLERSGGPCGVITTRGFRDVLELRRRDRPEVWGLRGSFRPIVPRDLRLEVTERTLADGTVIEPVDLDDVRAAARSLLERGARAVAIVFLNSYASPANERAALEAVREIWPTEHVCASSDILREVREFERSSTTALNGYLQPVVGPYLDRLEVELGAAGFAGRFLILQSNGGIMTSDSARRYPIRTALSGPAAGVTASAAIGAAIEQRDLITCDMGGTSFDVALVHDGEAVLSPESYVDFGLAVRSPMVEVTTIGAGGGSIARVDAGGMLRVGPASAGSIPGPACYGMGNEHPTVTDANVVLGRIDADSPIGGRISRLDLDAARRALSEHVAEPLGMDVVQAAAAVLEVSLAQMAGAVRLITVQRGHDPARFALMPFGGAGGLVMGALMRQIGCPRAVVPRFPGLTSALGCLIADLRTDEVQTIHTLLEELDPDRFNADLAGACRRVTETVRGAGIPVQSIDLLHELEMCYAGQSHTVAVPLPAGQDLTRDAIKAAFEASYTKGGAKSLPELPILCQTVRTSVIARRPVLALERFGPSQAASRQQAQRASRAVWFDGAYVEADVWDRLSLPVGADVAGPCILQQPDATVVLDPGLHGHVDELGNLLVTDRGDRDGV